MANPVSISKSLAAASSTGIGTLSSASPGVATLNSSSLDTQRRIIIWSTGATLASANFTVTGTREGGGGGTGTTVTETITGPASNTVVTTTQDFLSVTTVSASSAIANQATIGTNTVGGTPWQSVNLDLTPIQLGGAITFSSSAVGMSAQIDLTMDNPFSFGTFAPGGTPAPLNNPPIVFVSTLFSTGTSSNHAGAINAIGQALITPIVAWRMTLTSSSTNAGISANVSVIQAGIG